MFSFFSKKQNPIEEPFDADKLSKKLTDVLAGYEDTKVRFEKIKFFIEGSFMLRGKEKEEAQSLTQEIEDGIMLLEKDLKEINDILRVFKQATKHLFTPLRRAQNIGTLLTILFGIVGILLTGPDIYEKFIEPHFREGDFTPDYYHNISLKRIRENINAQLLNDAITGSDDLLEKTQDPGLTGQALIYKTLALTLEEDKISADSLSNDFDILEQLSEIQDRDDFIAGQKILLTAVYHLKRDDFVEGDRIILKMLSEEKFEPFIFEATYYQSILRMRQANADQTDKLEESKAILNRLREQPFDAKFLDFISGKEIDKQEAINYASFSLNQKGEELNEVVKAKELEVRLKDISISIRYNVNRLAGHNTPDPKVESRARKFYRELQEKYPEIKLSFGPISSEEIQNGSYRDDNVYWKSDVAKLFFNAELVERNQYKRLQRFLFERRLSSRYKDFDLVFIFSKI